MLEKKIIQITLNLTKAKLSCLRSLTKNSTVKKLWYERENFTLAHQQVQEPDQQHNQPLQKSLLAEMPNKLHKLEGEG